MLTCMRTTLVLDDALLRQARLRAAERDQTVSEIVNEALRDAFDRPRPAPAAPFSMATHGDPTRRVRPEAEDVAAALEAEDRDRLR